MQEVRTTSTMTSALLALGDWLASLGVSRVVMEATSDYWRAPFYLLEDWFETWLVNAHDVKHLPGRPKTDRLDAVWLCKVAERQMLRPSFVPPPAIRALRDLTRYRVDPGWGSDGAGRRWPRMCGRVGVGGGRPMGRWAPSSEVAARMRSRSHR
jgi:hypothetical protein